MIPTKINIIRDLKQQIYVINIKLEETNKQKDSERDLKEIYESGIIPIRNKRLCKTEKSYDKISHIVNITMATMQKKRVISDDIINEVKKKLESGIKQSEIIKEMNLRRDIVNNIARGILLPLSASKEECKEKVIKKIERKEERDKVIDKKKYDGESSAIGKRAYNKDDGLKILRYTFNNKESITQSYLSEIYNLSLTQITNLLNGKTEIYKREFENEEEYNEYKKLLEEISKINFKENGRLIAKVKSRKLSPDMIINVIQYQKQNPNKSRKDIGKEFELTEEQVRSIICRRTQLYEFEFPINGVLWEEYNQ